LNRADQLNPECCGSQSANISIGNRCLKRSLLGRNTAFCSILALPSRGREQNPQRPCAAWLHRALTSDAADREAKKSCDSGAAGEFGINQISAIEVNLTMRLSDAGLRRRQTKLIDPNHQLAPKLNEDAITAIARTDC
jgi:hypothetical protein